MKYSLLKFLVIGVLMAAGSPAEARHRGRVVVHHHHRPVVVQYHPPPVRAHVQVGWYPAPARVTYRYPPSRTVFVYEQPHAEVVYVEMPPTAEPSPDPPADWIPHYVWCSAHAEWVWLEAAPAPGVRCYCR